MAMKINRRGLLTGIGISGLFALTSCVNYDEDPEPAASTTTVPPASDGGQDEDVFNELTQSDAYNEARLIFGDANSPNIATIILDFASLEAAEFYNSNRESLKEFYIQPDRRLELMMIVPPKEGNIPSLDGYSADTTAMGILVYMKDKERFWEYADIIFNRENKEIAEEELYQIGADFGIEPANAQSEMVATRMIIDRATFDAEYYTGGFNSPAMIVNNQLWEGDLFNEDEVKQTLSSIGG